MISIVTPTTPSRRDFLVKASHDLAAQDFKGQEVEWIILEESSTSGLQLRKPLLAFPAQFEQCSTRQQMSTGAKRNFINDLTHGETIVHWDDDDWYAPNRLSDQIAFFEASDKAVTGYHNILYWDLVGKRGFKYDDPTFRPHCAGTSLVYRKDFWKKYKFDDRPVAEDFLFCMWARNVQQLASKDGLDFVVARVHGGNTCDVLSRIGSSKFPAVSNSNFPAAFLLTL